MRLKVDLWSVDVVVVVVVVVEAYRTGVLTGLGL
jgi:hypothetical protein